MKADGEKKKATRLYMDADEEHAALQYLEKKGDIGKRKRINTVMPKIIYVYEGIVGKTGGRNWQKPDILDAYMKDSRE